MRLFQRLRRNRRASAPKPRPMELESSSRRNFLRLGLASAVLQLVRFSIPSFAVELALPPKLSPIITRGRGARSVIESYPNIAGKEMAWVKEFGKLGEMRPVALSQDRKRNKVALSMLPKTVVRSLIHVHPIQSVRPDLSRKKRVLSATRPGSGDLLAMLDNNVYFKKPLTNHIAVVNENGKVIGYVSVRVGKPLSDLAYSLNDSFMNLSKKLLNVQQKLLQFESNGSARSYWSASRQYLTLIEKFKKLGLRIRYTPMPEFQFKNGYFQPKR